MGFLDFLDNPDLMSQIIGGGGPGTDPGANQPAPPMPPASAMPQGQPPQSADPMLQGGLPGIATGALPPGTDPQVTADFGPNGVPLPPRQGGIGSDHASGAPPGAVPGHGGIGSDYASSGGQRPGGPGPTDAPTIGPGMQPPPAPLDISANGPGAPGGPGQPPPPHATPAAYTPPMPPASAMPGPGAPTTSTTGSLAGMLGIDPKRLRAGMAGVGRGLTAVGNAPAGATAGQMFGRGAGGSLQGVAAAQEQQKTQDFNQASTYFRDMLAAKAQNNAEGFNKAREQYFLSRAQSLMTGGGNGSKTLNTPAAITGFVEGKAVQMRNQFKQEQLEIAKATGKDYNSDLVEKQTEQYRQGLYKHFGMKPDQVEKAKNAGLTQDNPIDASGMSANQFHTLVPANAYYDSGKKYGTDGSYTAPGPDGQPRTLKGKPGSPVILRRPDRPGIPNETPAAGPGQPGATQSLYDDQAALSPA